MGGEGWGWNGMREEEERRLCPISRKKRKTD